MQKLHRGNTTGDAGREAEIAQGVCKKARGGMQKSSKGVQKGAKSARSTVVDVVKESNQIQSKKQHQQHADPRVEKIFEHIGVKDPQLAARVRFEIAREWLYWIFHFCGSSFNDPPAFMARRLRANPDAHCLDRSLAERKMRESPHEFDRIWSDEGDTPLAPGEMELDF